MCQAEKNKQCSARDTLNIMSNPRRLGHPPGKKKRKRNIDGLRNQQPNAESAIGNLFNAEDKEDDLTSWDPHVVY